MSDIRKSSKRSAKVAAAGAPTKMAAKAKRGFHPPSEDGTNGTLTIIAPTGDEVGGGRESGHHIQVEYVTEAEDGPIVAPPEVPLDPEETEAAHVAVAIAAPQELTKEEPAIVETEPVSVSAAPITSVASHPASHPVQSAAPHVSAPSSPSQSQSHLVSTTTGHAIPPAPAYVPMQPLLFEIAWEVCWQLGGIYTVIRSKAPQMTRIWGERYCLIGPYNAATADVELEETQPTGPIAIAIERLRAMGIRVHYGHWLITGRPRVILLEFGAAMDRWASLNITSGKTITFRRRRMIGR